MDPATKIGQHVRSNAVAYLALFVALGGTEAWAADQITSKGIAKNAVLSESGNAEPSDLDVEVEYTQALC